MASGRSGAMMSREELNRYVHDPKAFSPSFFPDNRVSIAYDPIEFTTAKYVPWQWERKCWGLSWHCLGPTRKEKGKEREWEDGELERSTNLQDNVDHVNIHRRQYKEEGLRHLRKRQWNWIPPFWLFLLRRVNWRWVKSKKRNEKWTRWMRVISIGERLRNLERYLPICDKA